MWCPLPSTHTLTRAPLFDERAASSSRFFSSSSSSLPIARHPRHKGAATRERAPPRTLNVVTTQARDDGSPFLLFCLGFRGSFPKFLGPFLSTHNKSSVFGYYFTPKTLCAFWFASQATPEEEGRKAHAPRRRRRRLSRTERGREIDDVFFCVYCEPSPRVEHEKDRTDDDDDDDAGTQLENVVRARRGFRGVDVDVGVF